MAGVLIRFFRLATASKLALRPTQLPIQCVPRFLTQE